VVGVDRSASSVLRVELLERGALLVGEQIRADASRPPVADHAATGVYLREVDKPAEQIAIIDVGEEAVSAKRSHASARSLYAVDTREAKSGIAQLRDKSQKKGREVGASHPRGWVW
jgi:hypothetical protein